MRHYASISLLVIGCLVAALLSGCAGEVTMPESARAGDTVMLAAGWKHSFNHNNITVTITDADSNTTTYQPGDPAIRSVINLYPDPASYMSVGTKIGGGISTQYLYGYGADYGDETDINETDFDPDWWESMVYLDLPATMATGQAEITIESPTESYGPVPVNIIPGTGSPATFSTDLIGPLSPDEMQSMERAPVWVVTFSGGASLPEAIQVQLTHDPDAAAGGTGKPHVINPVGDMKNLTWTESDDGQHLKVIVFSNGDGTENDPHKADYGLKLYKFYVAGEVQNLSVSSVSAFDANGNPITGVTASIAAQ